MANDLLSLIREKKQLIAKTQAELDEAMRELQTETDEVVTLHGLAPTRRTRKRRAAVGSVRRRRRRADSSTTRAAAVLEDAGQPLLVEELLKRIEHRFHQKVKKATLVGNLARKVKAGDTFDRPAPSTYGLVKFRKDKQLKVS